MKRLDSFEETIINIIQNEVSKFQESFKSSFKEVNQMDPYIPSIKKDSLNTTLSNKSGELSQ